MAGRTIVAFDAYGTLLSTESIAQKLAVHFGQDKAQTIAGTWRKYQLEYTWRLNSMDHYEDFSKVTRRSLHHALAESEVELNEQDTDELMQAYDTLSIFANVGSALEKLKQADQVEAYVFSNGTHKMVSSSIHKSPDLKPYSHIFKGIVVVEEVKKFKPHPETYYHLAKTVGKDPTSAKEMSEMWLVSGNPFDIVGARAVGMKAAWVDRAGNGWQDAVVNGEAGRPSVIGKSLEEVVNAIFKQ